MELRPCWSRPNLLRSCPLRRAPSVLAWVGLASFLPAEACSVRAGLVCHWAWCWLATGLNLLNDWLAAPRQSLPRQCLPRQSLPCACNPTAVDVRRPEGTRPGGGTGTNTLPNCGPWAKVCRDKPSVWARRRFADEFKMLPKKSPPVFAKKTPATLLPFPSRSFGRRI